MAQIILARGLGREGVTEEVLEVFEDGRHPGFKVVQDPRVWNSTPTETFRIIQVPLIFASAFDHLLVKDTDIRGVQKSDALRVLIIDLTAMRTLSLQVSRTIQLTTLQVTFSRNPQASDP